MIKVFFSISVAAAVFTGTIIANAQETASTGACKTKIVSQESVNGKTIIRVTCKK